MADVRPGRAEIWSGLKTPIVAQQTIAKALGLPVDKVTVHVVQAGGSFGRRLFFDAALEAAQVSRASRRPIRLMWSRVDDMRHGRMRPATHHRIRAAHARGQVIAFDHRIAAVETDFRHGLGEILTATVTKLPGSLGNKTFAQILFHTTVKCPYHFGVTTQHLTEVPLKMPTASWRSVYSANARGAEEIVVDELAAELGKDPVDFRRSALRNPAQRAVLDKVAHEGEWWRLPPGHAQGVGFHEEYKSRTACLVEIDATDPKHPRVTKAVIAADVGRPINPRGLEAQLLGGLTDAVSTTLRAGLHLDKGLPLEGSYSQFHYARQKDSPPEVRIFILPATGEPGGAGELGVPAAVGAIANAYARATGTRPRRFPVNFDVDFTPYPR
ncbi:molybdopterin cofactor-binding domain-containing protein [Streptomyces stramineus]